MGKPAVAAAAIGALALSACSSAVVLSRVDENELRVFPDETKVDVDARLGAPEIERYDAAGGIHARYEEYGAPSGWASPQAKVPSAAALGVADVATLGATSVEVKNRWRVVLYVKYRPDQRVECITYWTHYDTALPPLGYDSPKCQRGPLSMFRDLPRFFVDYSEQQRPQAF